MKSDPSPSTLKAASYLPEEPAYQLVRQASRPDPACAWERPSGLPHAVSRTASGRMQMAPRVLLERDPALQPGYLASRVHSYSVAPIGTLGTELLEPARALDAEPSKV
ncbi:MAG TPA: hypothetical protein VIN58_24510, partial [Roseateles sp.]